MTKLERMSIFIVVLGLVSSPAFAGLTETNEVFVSSGYFQGSLQDARHSSDTRQYIGCQLSGNPYGGLTADCWASDRNGTFGFCEAQNDAQIRAIMAADTGSYLSISFDPATNKCTYVNVYNFSWAIRN